MLKCIVGLCIIDIVNHLNITGGNRNTLCSIASNFVYCHHISCDRVLLVSIQNPLVLVCIILHISIFRVSRDVFSFIELKSGDSLHIGDCCLHHIESFLRVPSARTGKPYLPSLLSLFILFTISVKGLFVT